MNRALWRKAIADCWLQWLISAAILVGFSWIFIWLISRVPSGALAPLLQVFGGFLEKVVGLPVKDMLSPAGRLSVLFVHVVTMLVCVGWAVGRGSAPISGEVGRGRMDLLATLPIRRATLIFIPAVIAAAGALLLTLAIWLGIALGLKTVTLEGPVRLGQFTPAVENLFAMIFCLTGITCMVSSWVADRWRAIFIAVGVFLISYILKMIGQMWPDGGWIQYGSFLSAFQPQQLVFRTEPGDWTAFCYNMVLFGLGLTCYLIAAVVFSRRDVPVGR
jgi:ABC-2 type transport system permease protein